MTTGRSMMLALMRTAATALVMAAALAQPAHALGQRSIVSFEASAGSMALAHKGQAASIYVDAQDYAGVLRAAADLQGDVQRVAGVKPRLYKGGTPQGSDVIIIGTLGKSALIDALVASGALKVDAIAGKWEGFQVQTLAHPLPGVERALVIVGSDKRGAIFGIYELSEQIGVSPWSWWADVAPRRHASVFASAQAPLADAPVVKYRGIFLNDEAPALSSWVKQHYGNYNHNFYEKVFELILRLRGNYLWPAMWGSAFYDDDKLNGPTADMYGVVMGTSHHEPMMRAQQEWGRHGKGAWDYNKNAAELSKFWTASARATRDYEKLVTIGMRGDGDEPMSEQSNVALLEKIVRDQRSIIASEINPDVTKVPQVWALYKEVQDYYEKGMRVPDDVTLLWCDDNWGNIRRLPTLDERKRAGGAGVYYHFDYVGGPRSYKWINVTPIPKIWEQMHLAWQHEANRLWIVNVGDLKPMEVPIEFFLTYAWNPAAWPAERLPDYLKLWATREFGAAHADDIAAIVSAYTRYHGRRKPELLAPDTYSLTNYNEAERISTEFRDLLARAEKVGKAMPPALRDAYFQLVLHPVKASAIVNELYITAARNRLYAQQGRASANDLAAKARTLFAQDAALTQQYHRINGGKWNHMMDQTHLGYTFWNQPPRNTMPAVTEIQTSQAGDMGVAVEGSELVWPRWGDDSLTLPTLSVFERRSRYVDVFNRGELPFEFAISASEPWVTLSQSGGKVTREQRVMVDVRWDQAPLDTKEATLTVTGPDKARSMIRVPVFNPAAVRPAQAHGFVESGGVVSIEAAHFASAPAAGGRSWQVIPGHGRTLSSVTTMPSDAAPLTLADGMQLVYPVHLFSAGKVKVQATLAPTLKFRPGQGLRYAVSIDDEAPQIVNMHADASEAHWAKTVSDGAAMFTSEHMVSTAGAHTLRFWALDAGVVLQKLVIDAGGLKPSYLGPPESVQLR